MFNEITMRHLLIVLCFAVLQIGKAPLVAQTKYPYQNEGLPVEERVADLVGRMTLEEKLNQLFHGAPAIDRLGVPAYNWWNECLHGVARAGRATVFPQAIGLAATFDENLMLRLSTAISDEARAKHHYFVRNNARGIYMGLTFWTPNINIFRDPRWGRGQETYGEDPHLTSRMAVNFIKGLQGDHPKYLKTIATAKHYAVHSGPEFTRHSDNIFVHDRDLYDTYLPAFRAAVKEANVQSVMCAYNRFRDKPCCGSDLLLSNILRQQFGFNGYIVSDCGAITDVYKKEYHSMVEKPTQAWGWTLASGTDLNCEEDKAFMNDNIKEAVQTGVVNERDVDIAVTRLFTARFRLGMFDSEQQNPYASIPMSTVGSAKHRALALEAAEKSIVLLKNDGILPLKANQRIALIGPNAENMSVLLGNYNGDPIQPFTPLAALRQRVGKSLQYAAGAPLVPDVYTDYKAISADNLFHKEGGKLRKGLKAEYFSDTEFTTQKFSRVDNTIDFYWEKSPINNIIDESFSVRWTGVLIPREAGKYRFGGNVTVLLDGKAVADKEISLEKGKQYALEVRHVAKSFWYSSALQQQRAELHWVKTDRDYRSAALNAAKNADVVIFCGGISPNLEGEEMKVELDGFAHGDRTHINLPQVQEDLLKEVYGVNKKIVYINFSGSAIALNWQKDNVPGILQAFYPGEATGLALTKILFGETNPSGRLPVTFYNSVDDLPAFLDYRMQGRTYRYFDGNVLYPFGYGLSYTTFSVSAEAPSKVNTNSNVELSVSVQNKGAKDGEEVIQVYATLLDAKDPKPFKTLVAFKRVSLKAGETKTETISIPGEKFAVVDARNDRVVLPGKVRLQVGGNPLIDNNAKGVTLELEFAGDEYIVPEK